MNNFQKGFTLLEMMIYVALFSLIMTGTFVVAFQLITNSERTNARVVIQEEGNFLLRKISWALSGASSITSPSATLTTSSTLIVNKYGFSANPITIRYNSVNGSIEIQEGAGNPFYPLTSDGVVVSSLEFTYIPEVGSAPLGVQASTTMNGISFTITKYIRK